MISRICKECGEEFKTHECWVKRGESNFCSKKCSSIWMSKNRIGSKSSGWKGGKIKKICLECGKDFLIPKAWAKRNEGFFCSKICKHMYARKNSKQNINKLIRKSFQYNEWRQQIFLRDDFTCLKCKNRGGFVHAHHKKPLHRLVKEASINLPLLSVYDSAMAYTPLWDISNGETLCVKCHRKINTRN